MTVGGYLDQLKRKDRLKDKYKKETNFKDGIKV